MGEAGTMMSLPTKEQEMSAAFRISGTRGAAVGAAGANGATLHVRNADGAVGGTQVHDDKVDYSGRYGVARGEDGSVTGAAANRSWSAANGASRQVSMGYDGDSYRRTASGTTAQGYGYQRSVTAEQGGLQRSVELSNPDGESMASFSVNGLPRAVIKG